MAAKYTPEGEGLAGEGWNIKPDVIAAICTDFNAAFSKQLSNQADAQVAFFDSILTARLTPGSCFQ